NGKTLLLDVFRMKLAREIEPDDWEYLRDDLSRAKCIEQVWSAKEVTGQIPVATIDFGKVVPDAFSALASLRRQLPAIPFPRFELAAVAELAQSGQLTHQSIAKYFLSSDVPQLLEIAAAFGMGVPGQGFA